MGNGDFVVLLLCCSGSAGAAVEPRRKLFLAFLTMCFFAEAWVVSRNLSKPVKYVLAQFSGMIN